MSNRLLTAFRDFLAECSEIQERLVLLNRPWEEEYLHWSGDTLHGHVVPPARRRCSVTRSGWCAATRGSFPE